MTVSSSALPDQDAAKKCGDVDKAVKDKDNVSASSASASGKRRFWGWLWDGVVKQKEKDPANDSDLSIVANDLDNVGGNRPLLHGASHQQGENHDVTARENTGRTKRSDHWISSIQKNTGQQKSQQGQHDNGNDQPMRLDLPQKQSERERFAREKHEQGLRPVSAVDQQQPDQKQQHQPQRHHQNGAISNTISRETRQPTANETTTKVELSLSLKRKREATDQEEMPQQREEQQRVNYHKDLLALADQMTSNRKRMLQLEQELGQAKRENKFLKTRQTQWVAKNQKRFHMQLAQQKRQHQQELKETKKELVATKKELAKLQKSVKLCAV